MSSDSSPSPTSPIQPIASGSSSPPVSPLTLPGTNDSSTSFNSVRLDPIIEHVKADHVQLRRISLHHRQSSSSGISFKTNGVQEPTGSLTAKPPSRVRERSPPAAAYVSPLFLSVSSRSCFRVFGFARKSYCLWGLRFNLYRRDLPPRSTAIQPRVAYPALRPRGRVTNPTLLLAGPQVAQVGFCCVPI